MARVKIKFPEENPLFQTRIPIRIGDINYGNHMGNDALLSILHEARLQMLAANGLSELEAGGHGMIMADVMIAYKGEAFYGDVLSVEIFAVEITGLSFNLLYRVDTLRNGQPARIAEAKTGMVCYDYAARKVTGMSERLAAVLKK